MSRAAAGRRPASEHLSARPRPMAQGYFHWSELPWASLVFLLPLLVVHEAGARMVASRSLYATSHLLEFFQWFGATGRHLPALAVVGILLTWHIARNDSWQVRGGALLGMLLESLLLAVPLIVMLSLVQRYVPLAAGLGWQDSIILSLGAGIYEELLFRLMLFTLLNLLLVDVLKIPWLPASLGMVAVSAVLFSLYHYLGSESFHLQTFAFRTLAGVYFGSVFLCRGFGITAGSHAAYDVVVVALRGLSPSP